MTKSLGEEFDEKYRAIPYPERPKKPVRADYDSHAAHGAALDEWETAMTHHKDREREYRAAQSAVEEEFIAAVAADLGLTGHPKFATLYRIAYEEGHPYGFSEVYQRCCALAPLLED